MNQLPTQGQLTPLNQNLPSRRRLLDDVSHGLGITRPPHISIRGGRFTFVTAAGDRLCPTHHLDIVVVDGNKFDARVFFEGDFDPQSMDTPPLCFSDNGVGPSKDAIEPQAPTCQQCQWNVRGTDYTFSGKATTACTKRKKLAVIEDQSPDLTIYEFAITPGSLSNFRAYTDWLGKQAHPREARQCDICDVVTRVEWDTTKQFVMKFSCVAWADDEVTLQKVEHIFQNNLGAIACGRLDVAIDPAMFSALPRPAAQLALPQSDQQMLSPVGHQLPPPRQQFTQSQQIPYQTQAGPAQQAPTPPKPRARRGANNALPPPNAGQMTAPFMAPAADAGQAAAAQSPAQQSAPTPMQQVQDAERTGDIPDFLRRQQSQQPAAQQPTPARFGIAQAPPPPAAIQDAVQQAMSLPSRRG